MIYTNPVVKNAMCHTSEWWHMLGSCDCVSGALPLWLSYPISQRGKLSAVIALHIRAASIR